MKFWWYVTVFGSAFGMLVTLIAIGAGSAPQQAAAAAIAVALAVIPYCMARSLSELKVLEQQKIKKIEVKKPTEDKGNWPQ